MSRPGRHFVVILLGSAVACALLVAGGGCSRTHSRAKVIRIGYAIEAPYAFVTRGGEVTGESPVLAKKIASMLGIEKIVWVQSEFGSLIDGLRAGRYDVVAAGMFITPERARLVSFSTPTFHVREGLLVATGNPHNLHAYSDALDRSGMKIAVIAGSVEERVLRTMGCSSSRLLAVPDAISGRVSVESGLAGCLALSSPSIHWMAENEELGKTQVADPFVQPALLGKLKLGYGAFAFRKGETRLLSAWNSALHRFIGTPEHRRLVRRFGFTDGEMPGGVTTKEILEER